MHGHVHAGPRQLALVEEAQPRREVGDGGGRLMLRPGKARRGARLVVVLEEARQPILIVEARRQMGAQRAGIGIAQPVVQTLVVAVVEALLLQVPFEVPIGFGQEGEAGMGPAHGRDRRRPERRRRPAPGALEDLGQDKHRHVAAHAVALPGNRQQFRRLGRLQRRIGIVELQRIRPAGEIRIAPIGQDAGTLVRLDPAVVLRRRRQGLLVALDVKIRMRLDPGMIERGVIGREIEHEPQAARGQPGAERGQGRLRRPALRRPRRRRWRSPIR